MPHFGPADVGSRVSVRVHAPDVVEPDGRPRFRDVVGTLVALDGHAWRVRRRDGSEVTITPGTVVAARIVPDTSTRLRRAVDVDTATLEQIAAAGWQPLESEPLGGWVLRAANGFTGRANSTLALADPGCDWSTAFEQVASGTARGASSPPCKWHCRGRRRWTIGWPLPAGWPSPRCGSRWSTSPPR